MSLSVFVCNTAESFCNAVLKVEAQYVESTFRVLALNALPGFFIQTEPAFFLRGVKPH